MANQLQALKLAPAQIFDPYPLTEGAARSELRPFRPVGCIGGLGSSPSDLIARIRRQLLGS